MSFIFLCDSAKKEWEAWRRRLSKPENFTPSPHEFFTVIITHEQSFLSFT
jgi:hypothetical protein